MGSGSAELWRQAQEIFGQALEMPEEDRPTFVEAACGGDEALLHEVRSLLEANREASGFFEGLADKVADAADREAEPPYPLTGTRVGHFDVLAAIGRGGMGEVYRAFDSRLEREVALKVLPAELAENPQHVARFRREGKIVASLNHPNIASIHGVEEVDGNIFLVLELVEGPTLADRLAEGPLELREALDIARQISEALEVAHDTGIVHRDLKPANVKVDEDGAVRVLDFGIAKPLARRRPPGAVNVSPSTPLDVTIPGMVLGTAGYMSPEQARGKPIDHRTDIWAFGSLLYEMLSGRRAFGGEDLTQVVARILESSPEWGALPPGTPRAVRALLERCLEKSPRRRLQAIGEARIVLEDALASTEPESRPEPVAGRLRAAWAAVAVAAGFGLGALAVAWWGPEGPAERTSRTFRLAVTEDASVATLAPSGDRLVFAEDDGARVLFFDGTDPVRPEGSEGGYAFFWSPDSESLGFVRDGVIWRTRAVGGQPARVAAIRPGGFFSAAWLENGTIVASDLEGIVAFPETGGEPSRLWSLPEGDGPVRALQPGPDGSLFMVRHERTISLLRDGVLTDVYTTEQGTLAALAYAPPSHVLFLRRLSDPGIWALPVDGAGTDGGSPFLVTVTETPPSASRNGDLAYFDRRTSRQRRNLIWVDRSGQVTGVVGPPLARLEQFDLAPSGRRVVAVAEEEGRRRIWVHDLESNERYALSPMPDPGQRWPAWSPREDRIVFRFDKDGEQWFGMKVIEPGADPVHFGPGIFPTFTPDGKVLFSLGGDIYRLDPDRSEAPERFFGSPLGESQARTSVKGLVAFLGQTETGGEVFVTRYEDPSERWQVSGDGGDLPKWRDDGRELYYLAGETLMAVTVEYDGSAPRIGRPTRLFDVLNTGAWSLEYDPHPSGDRFLMLRALPRVDLEDVDAIVLVQDWLADFEPR